MLVESVAASVVVGKLRGGSLKKLGETEIPKWYLFISGFVVEFFSVYLAYRGVSFFSQNIFLIHLLSYSLVFFGLYYSRKSRIFLLIAFGIFLNFGVIMLNGGQMPVSRQALVEANLNSTIEALSTNSIITHTLIHDKTILAFLGDSIPLKKPYPRPKVISIGDIIMAAGVFMFIQNSMSKKV